MVAICAPCVELVDDDDTDTVTFEGAVYHGDCYDREFNIAYCGECGTTHANPGSCAEARA